MQKIIPCSTDEQVLDALKMGGLVAIVAAGENHLVVVDPSNEPLPDLEVESWHVSKPWVRAPHKDAEDRRHDVKGEFRAVAKGRELIYLGATTRTVRMVTAKISVHSSGDTKRESKSDAI